MTDINDAAMHLLVAENTKLKAQLSIANSILKNNLEWVRCGIGGNCSGYPKDHKDYILQAEHLKQFRVVNEKAD